MESTEWLNSVLLTGKVVDKKLVHQGSVGAVPTVVVLDVEWEDDVFPCRVDGKLADFINRTVDVGRPVRIVGRLARTKVVRLTDVGPEPGALFVQALHVELLAQPYTEVPR